jgi:hypothetical protein
LATASGCSSSAHLDQDGAVGADGHRGAQRLLALPQVTPQDTAMTLGGHALFLQAHRLFDGDLVEGVHAHLDVGDFVDAGAVGLDAHLDVVVDHSGPLDGDQDLHGRSASWSGSA